MKAYEALARAFAAEGCSVAFTLIGDGNMLPMVTMAGMAGHRLVQGRHEGAVIAMADGYSRASGELGFASVTDGPGLTQVPTSLRTAVMHRTPMVLFIGDTPRGAAHQHAYPQRELVESTGAVFCPVATTAQMLNTTRQAFFTARRDSIPVVLSVPIDIQNDEIGAFEYSPSTEHLPAAQRASGDPEILARIAMSLLHAERPVILAGRGAVLSGAGEDLRELGRRTGALTGTTMKALGLFAGSAQDLGLVGGYANPAVRDLLHQADFVLVVGARVGKHTSDDGRAFPQARVAHIDADPRGLEDGRFVADEYLEADARSAVRALLDVIPDVARATEFTDPGIITRLTAAREAAAASEPTTHGTHPAAFMRAIDSLLGADSFVMIGGGHFWAWPMLSLLSLTPDRYDVECDFAAISLGVPMAIGAAVALPGRRVICVEGDGSLLMNVQELETVAREQIPLAVLVINDGAYGSEVHRLAARGLDGSVAAYGLTDFAAIATAMGVPSAQTVTEPEVLASAIADYLADGTTVVLDLIVDPTVLARPLRRILHGEAAWPEGA